MMHEHPIHHHKVSAVNITVNERYVKISTYHKPRIDISNHRCVQGVVTANKAGKQLTKVGATPVDILKVS